MATTLTICPDPRLPSLIYVKPARFWPFLAPVYSLLMSLPDTFPKKTMPRGIADTPRSEEHTSELQSLMRISYAVFCLKQKKTINNLKHQMQHNHNHQTISE